MHRCGLLILTNHVSSLCHGDFIQRLVAGVKQLVKCTLYVHVENAVPLINDTKCSPSNAVTSTSFGHYTSLLETHVGTLPPVKFEPALFSQDIFPFISKFYTEAATQCEELNVNILLHNIGRSHVHPHRLSKRIQCIIADCTINDAEKDITDIFHKFVGSRYAGFDIQSNIPILSISDIEPLKIGNASLSVVPECASKSSVVIGGTFDHVHAGHKVLLSEATLLANKRLLIGLTDGEMLKRKTLSDLIKPWLKRKQQLQQFLCDVADYTSAEDWEEGTEGSILEIVRILDPIGPASTDPDLQCIAVSKETERGGNIVNRKRVENGLNLLDVHLIGGGHLVKNENTAPINESKTSSSTLRYNSLGVLRQRPYTRDVLHSHDVYIIGLTGGIASGKTSISKHLENLGAVVVNCDKLGHKAYEPGTETFHKVVERFGKDIIAATGAIDRKILGQKVFNSNDEHHSALKDLNSLVWPEIRRLAQLEIDEAVRRKKDAGISGKVVCVLDAAVLLEAGWDEMLNEIWVSIIPQSEAIKRIEERDGRSKEEAEQRIQAQMSNQERVNRAHVVLSTLWETSRTLDQVKKAWALLEVRLQPEWNYEESIL